MQPIQFIFFDVNKKFIDQYKNILENKIPNATFVNDNLKSLIAKNKNINAIVSSANSCGSMNGGIDTIIDEILGGVEVLVKDKITSLGQVDNAGRNFLPVGYCVTVKKNNFTLFISPTMVMPMVLPKYSTNVSIAFYAIVKLAYMLAKQGERLVICCPCLGTGVGQMNPIDSAKQVLDAYEYFRQKFL